MLHKVYPICSDNFSYSFKRPFWFLIQLYIYMQDVYYMYFCEFMRKMPAKYFYTECIICLDNSSYSFRVNFISVVQICPTEISIIFSFFDRQWNMDTVKKPDFCRHIDSFPFFVLFWFFCFFFYNFYFVYKKKKTNGLQLFYWRFRHIAFLL